MKELPEHTMITTIKNNDSDISHCSGESYGKTLYHKDITGITGIKTGRRRQRLECQITDQRFP